VALEEARELQIRRRRAEAILDQVEAQEVDDLRREQRPMREPALPRIAAELHHGEPVDPAQRAVLHPPLALRQRTRRAETDHELDGRRRARDVPPAQRVGRGAPAEGLARARAPAPVAIEIGVAADHLLSRPIAREREGAVASDVDLRRRSRGGIDLRLRRIGEARTSARHERHREDAQRRVEGRRVQDAPSRRDRRALLRRDERARRGEEERECAQHHDRMLSARPGSARSRRTRGSLR
jgi:hypothetical protein